MEYRDISTHSKAFHPEDRYRIAIFLYKLVQLMPVSNTPEPYQQICGPGCDAPQR